MPADPVCQLLCLCLRHACAHACTHPEWILRVVKSICSFVCGLVCKGASGDTRCFASSREPRARFDTPRAMASLACDCPPTTTWHHVSQRKIRIVPSMLQVVVTDQCDQSIMYKKKSRPLGTARVMWKSSAVSSFGIASRCSLS